MGRSSTSYRLKDRAIPISARGLNHRKEILSQKLGSPMKREGWAASLYRNGLCFSKLLQICLMPESRAFGYLQLSEGGLH